MLSNFRNFYNFFSIHWREPHLKFPHEANAPRLPFPRQYYTFTPPTQIFFISIQSWRGTRDIKFSSLYNFFSLHWGAPHIKFRQKINAPPLPFPKPYYTFFYAPPHIFLTALQIWPGRLKTVY